MGYPIQILPIIVVRDAWENIKTFVSKIEFLILFESQFNVTEYQLKVLYWLYIPFLL